MLHTFRHEYVCAHMCMHLYIYIPLGKIKWHSLELLAADRSQELPG